MIITTPANQPPQGAPSMTAGTGYATPTVSHATVFSPSQADVNAYNHAPKLFRLTGSSRIYMLWPTGARNEDGAGTYINGVYSDNEGSSWSSRFTVFPAFEAVDLTGTVNSHVLVMTQIVPIGSRTFIIGEIQFIIWAGGLQTSRSSIGMIAMEITSGSWGDPRWINGSGLSLLSWSGEDLSMLYSAISGPGYLGGGLNIYGYPKIANNAPDNMIECGGYNCNSGLLRIGRGYNLSSGSSLLSFIYTQISTNGRLWSTEQVTSIPNSPSLVSCVKMVSGKYIIIWNPDSDRNKLTMGVSTDGVNFPNTYTVRGGTGIVPTYPGAYKGGGAQYPGSIELNDGRLLVAYSIQKETIATSTVTIP